MSIGQFFCVKGEPAPDVKLIEDIWALIRIHKDKEEIYQALETLRYYLGDYGVGKMVRVGREFKSLPFLSSPEAALAVLRQNGILLKVPKEFKW